MPPDLRRSLALTGVVAVTGVVMTAAVVVFAYYVGTFMAAIVFHLTHAGPFGLDLSYRMDGESDAWWSKYCFEAAGGILAASAVLAAFVLPAVAAKPIRPLWRWMAVASVAAAVLLQPVAKYAWLVRSVERDIDRQGYGSGRAESLVTLRGAKATPQLLEAMRTSASGSSDAAVALLRVEGARKALATIALDPAEPPAARVNAAFALAKRQLTTPAIDEAVSEVLRDPRTDRFVRLALAKQLSDRGGPGGPHVKAWLVQLLDDPDPAVRLNAATAIVSVYGVSDDRPCLVLKGLLGDANPIIRREAEKLLAACPSV